MLGRTRLSEDRNEISMEPDGNDLLQVIYEENLSAVYRFIYARVGNREEAEDLTSQVFTKAVALVDSTRDRSSIQAWLFQIAKTTLADHWRDLYKHRPFSLESLLDAGWEPADPEPRIPAEPDKRVEYILSRLSRRYQEVLTYRFLMNLSIRETATRMCLTEANIKVLQFRALRKAAEIDQVVSQ